MNPRLKALLDKKQALISEGNALEAQADHTPEQAARYAAIPGELAACNQAIEEAKAFSETLRNADLTLNGGQFSAAAANAVVQDIAREAGARFRGKVRNFQGNREEANRKAYRFGMWVLATMGKPQAMRFCQQNGLAIQSDPTGGVAFGGPSFNAALGQNESANEDGGFLVPPEFEDDMIVLRETYGIFRQHARIQPMGSDTKSRPRRKSGLTAYFAGDGDGATKSKMGWDRVGLTAKKAMILAYVTNELNEDAIIAMGDTLAGEMAYAFALLEDQCGFNGDGTAPYGDMVGVRTKLKNVSGTIANIKGLFVGSGNAYAELVKKDFSSVKGLLPQFADTLNTGWYVHKSFFHTVMEDMLTSLGGVTIKESELLDSRTPIFLGYPVWYSQVMPNAEANSQVCALFGDLGLAADFGDRRQTTIMFSEHAAFTSDEIAVRGTERFDINVHDVGDTVAAGPVVGLITAAS